MANTSADLVWLCKTEKGWRRYPVLSATNGRIRKGWVEVKTVDARGNPLTEEREYPIGRFQIRYWEGRQQKYRNAPNRAQDAAAAADTMQQQMSTAADARKAGNKVQAPEENKNRVRLGDATKKWLGVVEARGAEVAHDEYATSLALFHKAVKHTYVDELKPEDMLTFRVYLRKQKYADRTIHNKDSHIRSFLRYLRLNVEEFVRDAGPARYEKRKPRKYNADDLRALFAFMEEQEHNDRLWIAFRLLLVSGMRKQELQYLEWPSIDLKRGILRVEGNPRFAFKVKDKDQRDVVLEPELVQRMVAYRHAHPKLRLVVGTRSDLPDPHLLRTLKRLVNRAGLNCGLCDGCLRKKNPECRRWFLHKFRATNLTTVAKNTDLRTAMEFTGHSDVATAALYLSAAEDESVQDKVRSIQWY